MSRDWGATLSESSEFDRSRRTSPAGASGFAAASFHGIARCHGVRSGRQLEPLTQRGVVATPRREVEWYRYMTDTAKWGPAAVTGSNEPLTKLHPRNADASWRTRPTAQY